MLTVFMYSASLLDLHVWVNTPDILISRDEKNKEATIENIPQDRSESTETQLNGECSEVLE